MGIECIQDSCSSTQYLGRDGKCVTCESYTYPDQENLKCISDTCEGEDQEVGVDGKCKQIESEEAETEAPVESEENVNDQTVEEADPEG